MKKLEIKAVKREAFGKKESNKVRREGMVPVVIYGGGETVHLAVDAKELKPLIYTPNSYIVDFNIDGKIEEVVMREAQFHPVKEEILHIDFYRVIPNKAIAIDIPVKLAGNAEGVKVGGKLALSKRKIRVSGMVNDLPDELVIDITNLGLGKTIFVGDLNFDKLEMLTPATTAVCAVKMTRAARGAAAAAAAAAGKK